MRVARSLAARSNRTKNIHEGSPLSRSLSCFLSLANERSPPSNLAIVGTLNARNRPAPRRKRTSRPCYKQIAVPLLPYLCVRDESLRVSSLSAFAAFGVARLLLAFGPCCRAFDRSSRTLLRRLESVRTGKERTTRPLGDPACWFDVSCVEFSEIVDLALEILIVARRRYIEIYRSKYRYLDHLDFRMGKMEVGLTRGWEVLYQYFCFMGFFIQLNQCY